jgi:hypothetical protein
MKAACQAFFRFFSSLRLTVFLLGFAMMLVFFGTLDQVQEGIYEVQQRYFQSLVAFWRYPVQWPAGKVLQFLVLPMPGGYLLGFVFLLNLGCAHFRYFRLKWSNLGIAAIHAGLVLLLIGQFLSDQFQEDFQMWIDEGSSSDYAEGFFHHELAVIETTLPDRDRVWVMPDRALRSGLEMQNPDWPFSIRVMRYHPNASILQLEPEQTQGWVAVSAGAGKAHRLGVIERPLVRNPNERNLAVVVVGVYAEGKPVDSWVLSSAFEGQLPPQSFEWEGRRFVLSLRFERRHFPFDVQLKEFRHDRYPGTEIPMNFSSEVEVVEHASGERREVLILMNHPMRHGGYTFYQASFAKQDTASMLQVVRNPGWLVPYLSCAMVSLGLLFQFSWVLSKALRKRSS